MCKYLEKNHISNYEIIYSSQRIGGGFLFGHKLYRTKGTEFKKSSMYSRGL